MANDTLALDVSNWDLALDSAGSLATFGDAPITARDPQMGAGMRLAQDVATRLRAWRGEVWMDAEQGIDYQRYLGLAPSTVQLAADFHGEALQVPECATAVAALTLARGSRTVGGDITLSDLSGAAAQVTL